jgi:hypothetical protein
MAELNFGLLTPPGSQPIGNAFVSGMDQAAVARAQENQNALAQYTLSKARREDELTNQLLGDLRSATTNDEIYRAYQRAGKGDVASKLRGEALTQRKTEGDITAQRTKLIDDKLAQSRAMLEGVSTPEEYMAWHEANHADSVLGPVLAARGITAEQSRKRIEEALKTPGGLEQLINQSKLGVAKFAEMNKPSNVSQNFGGTAQVLSIPGMGGAATVVPGSVGTVTAAPSTEAALMSARAAGERNQIARARLENETATGKFTPDTVDFLAQTYIQTGNIPPLGMGRAAADLRQKVIERAAIVARTPATAAPGEAAPTPISAADAARTIWQNRQAFAGGTAGQRTLGTTLANVTSAATEANNMIPLVEKYAALVNPTDFPLVNAAGNFVSRQGGGENVVGLAGSLNSLVNAYARAINPKGVATVSDKNHAREIINEAMSKGQLNTALSVMRAEMESAMAAPVQVQERMRGGGKSQAPAAAATTPKAAPASGAIQDGYRFKGGDPAKASNWEKVGG